MMLMLIKLITLEMVGADRYFEDKLSAMPATSLWCVIVVFNTR